MSTDVISNFLSSIRNAGMAKMMRTVVPYSKVKANILKVLLEEGYIRSYQEVAEGIRRSLIIDIKYYRGAPVIQKLVRVSKPGKRIYYSLHDIDRNRYYGGLGIFILSTSKGIVSDYEAKSLGCGGEVICGVF